MAVRAVGSRECGSRRRVHGIVRLLPSRQVALGVSAVRRSNVQRIVAVDMALATLHRRVLVRQREARRTVIEFSVGPRRDRVTSRASARRRWETRCNVIRHVAAESCRTLPRRLMAAHTIG